MLLPLPRKPGFIRGGVPRIDWSNPITQGLTGFWLPALHGLPTIINLVNSRPGSLLNFSGGPSPYLDGFPAGQGISRIGVGVRLNFTSYYWDVGANKNFYDTSATFAFSRISAASDNALDQYGFSVTGASQTSFVPYSDGNIYWDFPNSGSRLGSLPYTNSAGLETFTFSARPGYRGIYKNGLQIGTSSAAAAGDGSTNGANLWFAYNSGPTAQYFVLAVWNRSLTDQEQIAFTLDPLQFLIWPEDDLFAQIVGVASGGTSYSFPTAGWVWNHQAPTLAFTNAATQKAWVWNHQAPTLAFASTSTQKAWVWAKGAPSLGFASATTQKAWVWVGGAPILSRTIAAAQKAWRWAAASPTMTGGNFNPLAAILRYLGPVWKRRRSRPPL